MREREIIKKHKYGGALRRHWSRPRPANNCAPRGARPQWRRCPVASLPPPPGVAGGRQAFRSRKERRIRGGSASRLGGAPRFTRSGKTSFSFPKPARSEPSPPPRTRGFRVGGGLRAPVLAPIGSPALGGIGLALTRSCHVWAVRRPGRLVVFLPPPPLLVFGSAVDRFMFILLPALVSTHKYK